MFYISRVNIDTTKKGQRRVVISAEYTALCSWFLRYSSSPAFHQQKQFKVILRAAIPHTIRDFPYN